MDKLIVDIRFFEADAPNESGMLPRRVGKLFDIQPGQTGDRVARKLRELGFTTGGAFDHVYINFTTAFPAGELSFPDRDMCGLQRFRFVDIGANPKAVNKLSKRKKRDWLTDAVFSAIEFIADENETKLKIVQSVRKEFDRDGENMRFTHKEKSTKTYSVVVSYEIATFGAKDSRGKKLHSTAQVEYTDKKTGECRRGILAVLQFHEDIFFLVSSLTVKSGVITFKPRTSYKAKLYNKRYKVPLSVNVADLEIV